LRLIERCSGLALCVLFVMVELMGFEPTTF
jgi:hypothetical protein